MTAHAYPALTYPALPCWGCALNMPLLDGTHTARDEFGAAVYACTAPKVSSK